MTSTAGKPLANLTIVDFGLGLPPALVVRLLADLGAKVRRVEPAGGDPFYAMYSAYPAWQRDKEISKAADVAAVAAELAAGADICIIGGEDWPGPSWRPDAETLARANPKLVILDIGSGRYGTPDAAAPAVDLLAQARTGFVFENYSDRAMLSALPVGSYGAALEGLVAVLAALCERERSGKGQIARTSLFEGVLSWLGHIWCESENTDRGMQFIVPKDVHPMIFRCADGGYIHFTMGTENSRLNIYRILGIDDPTVQDDPRGLPSLANGVRNFYGNIDQLQSYVGEWQRQDLLKELWALGLPAEAVNHPGEAWDDEQVVYNGVIHHEPDGTRRVGVPFRISLGDEAGKPTAKAAHDAHAPPLAGLRIVDFGNFTAGPHASMILADLGADVVKIEALTGDPIRGFYRPYSTSSRGKRCLAIDMKKPEGLEIARRLCASADMVHHNFRPGVTRRLGIDVDTLRALNPALIALENSGYGGEGPKSLRGGLDMIFQAFCGHEIRAGGAGNDPYCYRSTSVDFGAGVLGAIGALVAQYAKERSGAGGQVATSLLDTGFYLLSELVQAPDGAFLPLRPLNHTQTGFHPAEQLYKARDGWIAIAARGEEMAEKLLATLQLRDLVTRPVAEWDDEEAASIAASIAPQDSARLLAKLETAGVWAALCRADAQEAIFHDPQMRDGGTIVTSQHPRYGQVVQIGALFSFSRSAMKPRGDTPGLGQHSREVLAEAGYSHAEIDRLYEQKVVA